MTQSSAVEASTGVPAVELDWVETAGYWVALDGGKVVCKNPQGKLLSSLPKKVRDSEIVAELREVKQWLAEHERECKETIESWMSRSLPVPRGVLQAVWPDSAWRGLLENAVVWPLGANGKADIDRSGFFRGVDDERGVGVVNLDGETVWIDAPSVAIPHPVLIEEVNDFRELATELQITQGLSQLFRETYTHPQKLEEEDTSIDQFSGGEFEQLTHAMGRARRYNFRVRGGYAICPIWEDAERYEARFWIGADDPYYETETGELLWVAGKNERLLPVRDVPKVALSEGMRMASLIYAGRKVEKKEDEED